LERHYKEQLSDYSAWNQKEHAEKWLLFPENIGSRVSIDETSLSNGELYTIVTNKSAKGKKGVLVAIVARTKVEDVNNLLDKVAEEKLNAVEEVTLDMSNSMRNIVRHSFPKAQGVIDRFHVQEMPYKRYVLPIVGMLSIRKLKKKKKPNWKTKNTNLMCLKMATLSNNYLLEAVTYYSNRQISGRSLKNYVPNCSLNFILIFNRHIH
jgi:transposase